MGGANITRREVEKEEEEGILVCSAAVASRMPLLR